MFFFSDSDLLSFYSLSHALIFNLFKCNKSPRLCTFKKIFKIRKSKTFLLHGLNHIREGKLFNILLINLLYLHFRTSQIVANNLERPGNLLNKIMRKIQYFCKLRLSFSKRYFSREVIIQLH